MASSHDIIQAKIAFETLCDMLDDRNWKYTKDEEKLTVYSGASGDDLPIDLRIVVDPDKLLVSLYSKLPFNVPDEEKVTMAVAVAAANYNMVDGSFDYNLANGNLLFRMTSSIRESVISKEVFEYMLYVSCATIDAYNDKFFMLTKNKLSIAEFIKFSKE